MKAPRLMRAWVAGATLLLAAACGPAEEAPAEMAMEAPPVAPPDTTAAALWAHLQSQDYRAGWAMWPGKGALYTGQEPHGMLLTTYVNQAGQAALAAGQVATLPAGTIIVKENWMPDSSFAAATVMYKVAGYNPDHQDWLFAKYTPAGDAEAFGRVAMCQDCHRAAAAGYIYTPVP